MKKIGTSSVSLKDINVLPIIGGDYVGYAGPTGPTGATGITGTTGSAGVTGLSIVSVSAVDNDTIKILFGDSTYLTATGAAGNTAYGITLNDLIYLTDNQYTFYIQQLSSNPEPTNLQKLPTTFSFRGSTHTLIKSFKNLFVTGDVSWSLNSNTITLTGKTAGGTPKSFLVGSLIYFPGATYAIPVANGENVIAGYTAQTHGITTESVLNARITTFKEYKTLSGLTNINIQTSSTWSATPFLADENIHGGLTMDIKNANTSIDRLKIFADGTGITLVNKKYIKYVLNNTLEGISFEENVISGKTFSVASKLYGSCCYCQERGAGDTADVNICLDYVNKKYCEDIVNGSFSFKSCSSRRTDPNGKCYYGGSCCVNGGCYDNVSELECKRYNGFFNRGKVCLDSECPDLCNINPDTGEPEYSCCINGYCFNLPEDVCFTYGGIFQEKPCSEVNCCDYGYYGACCKGTECFENYSPRQCVDAGGIFQGAGSACSGLECCKESPVNPYKARSQASGYVAQANGEQEIPCNIKIGDYVAGGFFAGFIGYPTPPCWNTPPNPATGELLGNLEWSGERKIVKYVPVNGNYSDIHSCQCNNLSPERYVLQNDLEARSGKSVSINVNYITWNEKNGLTSSVPFMTYNNRIHETCLPKLYTGTDYCTGSPNGDRKYGYNSVSAFETVAKKIYTDGKVPRAWAVIISPEDVDSSNVSWGMSNSVNGFTVKETDIQYGLYLWENTESTPYGTSVVNGYLNTKMFDNTSGSALIWFTPSVNGVDPLAYRKFNHSLKNYWNPATDETRLNSNSAYYIQQYNLMWEQSNPVSSAIRKISDLNDAAYNGYSDWYIPSITELNLLYTNFTKINEVIIETETGELLSETDKYWSSTSGSIHSPTFMGALTHEGNINPNLEAKYNDTDSNKLLWKQYKTGMAHCMYVQSFINGKITSERRDSAVAKLRPIRMIPIYSYDAESEKQLLYSGANLFECENCAPIND